jgi:nicotinamidase-related amidase
MLTADSTVLIVTDVQGRLAQLMHEKEAFFRALSAAIRAMRTLEVPVVWLEQVPDKMGETTPEVARLLDGLSPIAKRSFSAWGEEKFRDALNGLGRRQVLLTGIETHICVLQTAADLIREGFSVQVMADAVASRAPLDKEIGLARARAAGALPTTVETAVFEIMGEAGGPGFREIIGIIK